MKGALRLEGGKEVAKALETLSKRVSKRVQRDALEMAGEPMRRSMARRAPHEPGPPDLRDTMVMSAAQGQDANEVAVAIGPSRSGFYGSFQELGTAHHPAQPFARPAFDEHAPDALRTIGDAFWTALASAGLGRSAVGGGSTSGGPGGSTL